MTIAPRHSSFAPKPEVVIIPPQPATMKLPVLFLVLASALPAVSDPTTRCTDAQCMNFQQEVSFNHQHWHRDADTACLNFGQFVPVNHRHVHRNQDATSPQFQQYTPDRRRRGR